jgi:hypothetical protein
MTVRKFIDEFVVEAEEDAIEGHPDGKVEAAAATVKRRRVQSSPPLHAIVVFSVIAAVTASRDRKTASQKAGRLPRATPAA